MKLDLLTASNGFLEVIAAQLSSLTVGLWHIFQQEQDVLGGFIIPTVMLHTSSDRTNDRRAVKIHCKIIKWNVGG